MVISGKNSPLTFMKFFHEVLHGIDNCYAYLDDILVFTDTEEAHLQVIEDIFKRLAQYGLALSLDKCAFAAPEVEFLGYTVFKHLSCRLLGSSKMVFSG